jgi:DNA replication protein DnaC
VIEQAFDGLCPRCATRVIAYTRYMQSNIPFGYWDLEMDQFAGAAKLKEVYNKLVADLSTVYKDGVSFCLASGHGTGKTTVVSNILKVASQKNYTCLYTTLNDMIAALIDSEDVYVARRELMSVDFLAIDELDRRFIQSESASDLFGALLEHIFRTRSQNKIPTFMCSNSPNPIEAFSGALKESIGSLMSGVELIRVIGEDFRKQSK